MNSAVRNIKIDREVSSGDFRGAMRQLTGGVSVITAGRARDISGMTVTSVSSLSVDPPTLIVSINRAASSWPLLNRYGFFGVNVLTSDQRDIAERFTGKGGLKGADRFAGAEWTTGASGVPLLKGALAAIDCEVEETIERHSHAIVIGRVLDLNLSTRTAALAYWQGQYVAIDQDEDAARRGEPAATLGSGADWRFFRSGPKSPLCHAFRQRRATERPDLMKRLAVWVFYGIGALAIGYLALYAYAMFTGRELQPGDPIHIFRKPDAPKYSAMTGAAPS